MRGFFLIQRLFVGGIYCLVAIIWPVSLFETGSCCRGQDSLELITLLCYLPKCWHYKDIQLSRVNFVQFKKKISTFFKLMFLFLQSQIILRYCQVPESLIFKFTLSVSSNSLFSDISNSYIVVVSTKFGEMWRTSHSLTCQWALLIS